MSIEKFVIAGDNHGKEQNDDLVEKFFEWKADFKPHRAIHGGDNWDFAALRQKATPAEQASDIAPDYEAGQDFAKRFFDGTRARYFTRGNHDERIFLLAERSTDAALKHYSSKMVTEIGELTRRLKVQVLPYDSRLGVLEVAGIRSIHGYAAGISAARRFGFIYGTCAFNHTHSMDVAPVERHPEPAIAYGVGCLCNIDQRYNHTQPGKLRHENGWLYGYTDGTRAHYFQARFKDGQVYASDTIKVY